MQYEVIEPEWENVARFMAANLADHSFDKGNTQVISFIETIRYLSQTDIDAVGRIIEELKRKA